MLLSSPANRRLGITTISGDQWMEPANVFAPQAPDREKWLGHLAPPPQFRPASVQTEVEVKNSTPSLLN
jgi:hypothetical protein